jgi:prepilin peptidase CpaA
VISGHTGAGLLLLPICVAGAWLDLRYRLLPNWLCAVALVSGLATALAIDGSGGFGSAVIHAGLALAVGAALFGAGLIGGGDAKYYAALAGWFPLAEGPRLLLMVALSGFVLSLAWILLAKFSRTPSAARANPTLLTSNVPYGVAISAGAFLAFVLRLPV